MTEPQTVREQLVKALESMVCAIDRKGVETLQYFMERVVAELPKARAAIKRAEREPELCPKCNKTIPDCAEEGCGVNFSGEGRCACREVTGTGT